MAFSKANILTTREPVFGAIRLGQILAIPTARLDKVSIYLEPYINDTVAAESINVIVEVYDLDGLGNPTGAPLASDYKTLSELVTKGYANFRIEATVPTIAAVVLRVPNGDPDNHVAWRYVSVSSGGQEQLISLDDGASWTQNPTRKFAYRTFSAVANAIDPDQQTALVQPGTLQSVIDDTTVEFELGTVDRAVVSGDTVAVNFGDFVVTVVVDQSGSMTWNDRDGVRYDFLKDFIADIDASLPSSSTATYSLIKFRGRRIGKMSISILGSEQNAFHFDGVRVVRKAGSAPVDISDGVVVFEGLGQQLIDNGISAPLVQGVVYHYSVFSFADFDGTPLYSGPRDDFALVVTPPTSNRPPFGVAGFEADAVITDNAGVDIAEGATDYGYRRVDMSWINPAGMNYSTITLVRRDDRMPESPADGTVLLSNVASSTVSYTDSFGGTYQFPTGLNYFYRIFTKNLDGVKCITANAQTATAAIQTVDRPWERLEPPANVPPFGFDVTSPGAPTVSVIESNGEIGLSWVAADVDSQRYKVFYKEDKFPIATDDHGKEYDGELLYDGTGTTFTHRSLVNGQPHFYVIIALDLVENASAPVKPLIAGRPPKPNEDAVLFLSPDPVSNVEVENTNSTTNLIRWDNPEGPAFSGETFFFGDTVRVLATVDFLDSGTSESFLTFEFVEKSRDIQLIDPEDSLDPQSIILFSHVPKTSSNSVSATVSVTPIQALQNRLNSASITFFAALRVKNRITGAVIAEVATSEITVGFQNPFAISIKNEPEQNVSRRKWIKQGEDPNNPLCNVFAYESDSFAGVYVLSGDPFFALVEASFRDQPLGEDLSVRVSLLDKTTGDPTTLVKIPQSNSAEAVLTISDVEDEAVDRSGSPSDDLIIRSLLPLILPPSNVPTDLIARVEGTFRGYVRTTELEIHYEPVLNIDLNLTAFQPDDVDRTEQSAFVYLAPYDAPAEEKIPVKDFTITDWQIRNICGPERPLYSEDAVPALGIKSYTHGGIARKIFWGPGGDVDDVERYEVTVKVQANGMSAVGHGMLELNPEIVATMNKIFLRSQDITKFYKDEIYSDGEATSSWEVLAHPEDEVGSDPTSGESFVNAVIAVGGNVPPNGLEDGRIVTMITRLIDNSDPQGNPLDGEEFRSVVESIRIKTNMTGSSGRSRSAQARVENGKALFEISVNARIPKEDDDKFSEEEVQENLFYRTLGLTFENPRTGLAIGLTVTTPVEINGKPVSFRGGGESLVMSAPPAFIGLREPLLLS